MRRIGLVGVFIGLALILTACFQSAGSAVEPTIANATATNPNNLPLPTFPTQPPPVTAPPVGGGDVPTFTPFMTPIGPEGFQTPIPTLDLGQPTIEPTVAPTIPAQRTEPPLIQPTVEPIQPTNPPPQTPIGTPIIPPTATVGGVDPTLATPTPLPTDPPCEYTVERNDTFYAIARKLKITPQELIDANPRSNPNALQIGEKLHIPNCKSAGTPAPTVSGTLGAATALPAGIQAVYIIQPGDTLGKIAQRYGVTVQEIVRANGFANENVTLNVDQKLLIPNRSQ